MMNYHVLTLFPEMIRDGLGTSIIGRALESGHISLEAVNIRDFAENKHKKVDDYPYGGGAGMVMQAEPVYQACQFVQSEILKKERKPGRVIYVTPQGQVFNQSMAEELAKEEDLIFLCGHYEGIDERVLEEVVTDYVSIGDYVLTGGELPAMVMIDAISRLVPHVLNNEESAEFESFQDNLLEYPQYSRPECWHQKAVPAVLLKGNHTHIEEWRHEHSRIRTRERRPDLYEKYQQTEKETEKKSGRKKLRRVLFLMDEEKGRALPWFGAFCQAAEELGVKLEFFSLEEAEVILPKIPDKRAEILVFADTVEGIRIARACRFRVVYFPEKSEEEPKDLVYYRKICDLVEGMGILRHFS